MGFSTSIPRGIAPLLLLLCACDSAPAGAEADSAVDAAPIDGDLPDAGPARCEGATHVVAPDGRDEGECPPDAPCATIQFAVDEATAGDLVCVRTGDYAERVTVERGGEAGAPLVLRAESSALAEGAAVSTVRGFAIHAPHVRVEGFRIQVDTAFNGARGEDANYDDCTGVYADRGGTELVGNHLADTYCQGIYLADRRAEHPPHRIVGNVLEDTGFRAIHVEGDDTVIEGNTIRRVHARAAWAEACMFPEADGLFFRGDGHIVRDNHISEIGRHLPHAPWPAHCPRPMGQPEPVPHVDCVQSGVGGSDLLYEGNTCEIAHTPDQVDGGSTGHAFRVDADRAPVLDMVIRNNVFLSQVAMPISISSGRHDVDRIDILNNTFVRVGPSSVEANAVNFTRGEGAFGAVRIINNIFSRQDSARWAYLRCAFDCAQVVRRHNLVYAEGAPLLEPTEINGAPGFLGPRDFHLSPDSPAVDAGEDLDNEGFDRDKDGRQRTAPWDIGAYERQ